MPKRKNTARIEDRGDANEPIACEPVNESDLSADFPPTHSNDPKTKGEFKSLPRQEFTTYPAGVHLIHDMEKGFYTIRFDPDMPRDDFKQFLDQSLAPMLLEQRQLTNGPTVRFHEQPDGSFEMRYRFREKDASGQPMVGEDGRKRWLSYHNQVSILVQRVADQAGRLLADKLGVSKSAEIPF